MTLLLNRWVQLAAALALAGVFALLYVKSVEARGELQANLGMVTKANASNQTTISELENALKLLVNQRRLDAEERERVLTERDGEIAAMRREADRARRQLNADFRSTPSCEELARLDIARACPAVAKRLQERSRGRDADGESPGGGG